MQFFGYGKDNDQNSFMLGFCLHIIECTEKVLGKYGDGVFKEMKIF